MATRLDRLATSALAESQIESGFYEPGRREYLPETDVDAHLRTHVMALRNIRDFLGMPREPDDMVASDYMPDALTFEIEPPEWLRQALRLFNKRGGHLTYDRGHGIAWWNGIANAKWASVSMAAFIDALGLLTINRNGNVWLLGKPRGSTSPLPTLPFG